MNKDKLKWEVRRRLEEMENSLYWRGYVQRSHLVDAFGISPQQATADFAQYQSIAPNNMSFNASLRRYESTEGFEPVFVSPDIESYYKWAEGVSGGVETVPVPERVVDLDVLKSITRAIHGKRSIEIGYQSMSSPEPSLRRLSPHTIVSDGYRYHVRGYCHKRGEFRDFVIGRISYARAEGKAGAVKEDDVAWNTMIPLIIGPHPGLTETQRAVIENDYGMSGGACTLKVRMALVMYALEHLRLDRFSEERKPAEQQIVLLNPEGLSLLT